MTLHELPGGVPPAVMARLQQQLSQQIRDAAEGRLSDVHRGAETPAVAAALFDKFGWGVTRAADAFGIDSAALQVQVDASARQIDPDFEAHRKARWEARPAAFAFERT